MVSNQATTNEYNNHCYLPCISSSSGRKEIQQREGVCRRLSESMCLKCRLYIVGIRPKVMGRVVIVLESGLGLGAEQPGSANQCCCGISAERGCRLTGRSNKDLERSFIPQKSDCTQVSRMPLSGLLYPLENTHRRNVEIFHGRLPRSQERLAQGSNLTVHLVCHEASVRRQQ